MKLRAAFRPVLAIFAALVACVFTAPARADGEFMRFPTSLSPDGRWVLAWGPTLPDASKAPTMKEVPYGTDLDFDSGAVNYLVDAVSGKVLAPIPGAEYWNTGHTRKNHGSLDLAWTPDCDAVFLMDQAKWNANAIVWIDTAGPRITDVAKQLDTAVHRLVLEQHGKKNAALATNCQYADPVFTAPGVLQLWANAYNMDKAADLLPSYMFRLTFRAARDARGAVRLELIKSTALKDDDYPNAHPIEDDKLEAALNESYGRLRDRLPEAARIALKEQQLRWLKARDTMPADNLKLDYTRLRVAEFKARAAAK